MADGVRGEPTLPLRAKDPRRVGVFDLLSRLGEGGMGVVYLGREPDDSLVAVKVVRDEIASDEQFRARFTREVRAMKGVRGARTANLIAANVRDTPQWVVMDYVAGPTLGRRVEDGPLAGAEVAALAADLAAGVSDIHAAGVVHRDLKPSNVVLADSGAVILDYGIARAMDATSVTMTGSRVGSLTWMAPEQIDGSGEGRPCDIHAIGLLVAFAATGVHPFGTGAQEAVAWRIVHQHPALDSLPELPGLAELVSACLASNPRDRPTAVELATAADAMAPEGDQAFRP